MSNVLKNNNSSTGVLFNCFLQSCLCSLVKQTFITKSDWVFITSSVIRQKGESQNGCFKKTKFCFPETTVLRFTLLPYYWRCNENSVRFCNEICFMVKYNFLSLSQSPISIDPHFNWLYLIEVQCRVCDIVSSVNREKT